MQNEKYFVIDDTEYSDFLTIIKEHGFECSDFDLSEINTSSNRSLNSSEVTLVPIIGEAVVTRKSTKSTRKYIAGNNKAWVADFQNQLAGGIFGQP
jgi:hypothetical protein